MTRYSLFTLLGLSCLLMVRVVVAAHGEVTEGGLEKATFAGGCFWCMEHPFDRLTGVTSTMMRNKSGWQRHQSTPWIWRSPLRNLSSPRLSRRLNFTVPRNTTRIFTGKDHSAIGTID